MNTKKWLISVFLMLFAIVIVLYGIFEVVHDDSEDVIDKNNVSVSVTTEKRKSPDVTVYDKSDKAEIVSDNEVSVSQNSEEKTEPVYSIRVEQGLEQVTKSEVENGASISVEAAMELASDFCETQMPMEDDLSFYVGFFFDTIEEARSALYSADLIDYNSECYLISVNYIECFYAISINKQTGDAKYCGSGQDYYRDCGWMEF